MPERYMTTEIVYVPLPCCVTVPNAGSAQPVMVPQRQTPIGPFGSMYSCRSMDQTKEGGKGTGGAGGGGVRSGSGGAGTFGGGGL